MSLPQLADRVAAVAAVLAELDVHRNERVLIMLPDEPGFDESFAGAVHQDAVPLPVSPRLRAHDLAAAAVAAGAHVVLVSPDQLPALTELDTGPAILINGPDGPWVAALRLR
ncbi:MAG: AMP-binding protein [Actinomycetota bacterium]|nr:AMP-binding protein [Actinomycetota bacterium]